ncbi:hypothetical protein H0E87_019881 [Populus deltoides]|uniref:Uncharacterized protein n=1 Tax=Populus deltoides TaxID=3696 RepID=A0A8T2XX15_POPDE|nr:hypothetical protein H0E87_019881 [Populus deltoides]
MAVAEQTTSPATAKYTKTSSRSHSSQLSHLSTSPSFRFRRSFRPIPRAQNFKITCSVNKFQPQLQFRPKKPRTSLNASTSTSEEKKMVSYDLIVSRNTEAELLPEKRCVAHLTGEGVAFRDLPEDTMLPGETLQIIAIAGSCSHLAQMAIAISFYPLPLVNILSPEVSSAQGTQVLCLSISECHACREQVLQTSDCNIKNILDL